MKVLIVDDNPFQLAIVKKMLTGLFDKEALCFSNVDECLFEMAVLDEPYILISDILIPKKSGISLIKELPRFKNLQALIILSSLETELLNSIARLARQLNIPQVLLLKKPTTRAELTETLDNLLIKMKKKKRDDVVSTSPQLSSYSLIESIIDDEFQPYFQPQIHAQTREVIGVELLGRLQRNRKFYLPNSFLPTLVKTKRITQYTFAIVEKGIKLLQTYSLNHLKLTINIDFESLKETDFVDGMLRLLKRLKFPTHKLVVEITEAHTDLSANILINLAELRIHNISISINVLSIEHSNFNTLLSLSFSELKIDRDLIARLRPNSKAYYILNILTTMTKKLNFSIVATGIETIEQEHLLTQLGVDILQGYLYKEPIPIHELADTIMLIENHHRLENKNRFAGE